LDSSIPDLGKHPWQIVGNFDSESIPENFSLGTGTSIKVFKNSCLRKGLFLEKCSLGTGVHKTNFLDNSGLGRGFYSAHKKESYSGPRKV
jgi:hypothetical protein